MVRESYCFAHNILGYIARLLVVLIVSHIQHLGQNSFRVSQQQNLIYRFMISIIICYIVWGSTTYMQNNEDTHLDMNTTHYNIYRIHCMFSKHISNAAQFTNTATTTLFIILFLIKMQKKINLNINSPWRRVSTESYKNQKRAYLWQHLDN